MEMNIKLLQGEKVVLRPPVPEDERWLFDVRNNVELQLQLMTLPRANTEARVWSWIQNRLNDPQGVFFIIADRTNQKPVGYLQLKGMDFVHGYGELGILIDPKLHGKGCAAEALDLLESYSRKVFNLRKITLSVLANNQRAVAFYRKQGYRDVGILQRHHYQNGSYLDVVLMEKFIVLEA